MTNSPRSQARAFSAANDEAQSAVVHLLPLIEVLARKVARSSIAEAANDNSADAADQAKPRRRG